MDSPHVRLMTGCVIALLAFAPVTYIQQKLKCADVSAPALD